MEFRGSICRFARPANQMPHHLNPRYAGGGAVGLGGVSADKYGLGAGEEARVTVVENTSVPILV